MNWFNIKFVYEHRYLGGWSLVMRMLYLVATEFKINWGSGKEWWRLCNSKYKPTSCMILFELGLASLIFAVFYWIIGNNLKCSNTRRDDTGNWCVCIDRGYQWSCWKDTKFLHARSHIRDTFGAKDYCAWGMPIHFLLTYF